MRQRASRCARPVVLVGLAGVLFFALPAGSAFGGVTMTSDPSPSVSGWTLASTGANTTSGGSMTISSTAPYTVTLTADRNFLSEWDGAAYVSGGKALTTPLTVTTVRTGGTAAVPGVGAAVVASTTAGTLATGTGLAITGATDIYSITLSQPTLIIDPALVTGHSYHIVLTYTAQLAL